MSKNVGMEMSDLENKLYLATQPPQLRSLHGLQARRGCSFSLSKEHCCFCQPRLFAKIWRGSKFSDTSTPITSSWSPDFSIGDSGGCAFMCSLQPCHLIIIKSWEWFLAQAALLQLQRTRLIYMLPSKPSIAFIAPFELVIG